MENGGGRSGWSLWREEAGLSVHARARTHARTAKTHFSQADTPEPAEVGHQRNTPHRVERPSTQAPEERAHRGLGQAHTGVTLL